MDVLQQVHKLGTLLNERNPATTALPIPMRIFALREAEKQIAEITEVTESTYAFAATTEKTIYDIPAFVLKPKMVEFRSGEIRYGVNMKPKRAFMNRQYVPAGAIPFEYNVWERRMEFRWGLQVPPTATGLTVTQFVVNLTQLTVTPPFNGADAFPSEGYLEITDDQTGFTEIVYYESMGVVGLNLVFNNIRRGQCGTFPTDISTTVSLRYLNVLIRYYREPETQRLFYGTGTFTNNLPDVTGVTITGAPALGSTPLAFLRDGWKLYVGATVDVILALFYLKTGIEPPNPFTIQQVSTGFTLDRDFVGASGATAFTLASVSEYPDSFHDLAVYKAASDLLKGQGDKRARDFEAEYQYRLKTMKRRLEVKTNDLYPRVVDYMEYESRIL